MKYDINVGNVRKIQNSIWDRIKSTFAFRKGYGEALPVFGHYGGLFKCGAEELVIHTDGVGTKLLVAQELDKFDTVGIDAIAMSVNDILCVGAEPLVGVDYIALAQEDNLLVDEIMKGLVVGAEESNCAIVGGETAIVPDMIKGGKRPFDLTFTVVGRVKKKVLGDQISKGDVMIGLESSGIHSNGYSLARKALDINKWGNEMLVPTKIYARAVIEMIDASDVHGIAHITGGGFSKINRLNKEIGYRITSLPKPAPIFEALYEQVDDFTEMHRTFNMGIGMVMIAPKDAEGTIFNIAKKHNVGAHVIGEVTDKKGIWMNDGKKDINLAYDK
jgi:phosphoribosylformylglycinamidine cyclo-ligase